MRKSQAENGADCQRKRPIDSSTTTRGTSSCRARSSWSADAPSTKPPITWPPSKPTSIRTRSPSATRHHLRENSVDRFRMDESNLEPEDALPRLGVDQLDALSDEIRERCAEIGALVGDVMHAVPSPRQ